MRQQGAMFDADGNTVSRAEKDAHTLTESMIFLAATSLNESAGGDHVSPGACR